MLHVLSPHFVGGVIGSISYPKIDPVFLRIGPLSLRWYGLAYLLGFACAYVMLQGMIARGSLRISKDALGELVSWLAMGVIVGGRGGWWLFYHRSTGALEPWYEPIAIWHGGMSFHGGLIGVVIGLVLWSWKRHAAFWNLADCLAQAIPVGLFFGRIANFINAELVGRRTDLPWGVVFPGENFPRHPSQLYEALLEGPVLLVALWLIAGLKRKDGFVASMFLVLYGLLRFVVEFTRQPDDQLGFIAFGWLTMGQLLSIGLSLIGAFATLIVVTRREMPLAGPSPAAEELPK